MFNREKLKIGQSKDDSPSAGTKLPNIGGLKLQPNGRSPINLNVKNQFQINKGNDADGDDSVSRSFDSDSHEEANAKVNKTPQIQKNGAPNLSPLDVLLKSAGASNT